MNNMEDVLKMLKKLGVQSAEVFRTDDGYQLAKVSFFPSSGEADIEKKPREDERVNAATGLTRSQTQDILGMDE